MSNNEKLILELDEIKIQNNEIMLENKNLHEEVDRLRENGDELATDISKLQNELSFYLKQHDENTTLNQIQKDDLTNNNNTLSSQLEQLQIKLDSITQHRDEILNKNDTLTSQLGRVQDELNQVINQQKDKDNSLISDLTKELNQMKEQCRTLNEQHKELQRQNHDIASEQKRLQTENERLQTELERMKVDSNNIVHQRDEFKLQNESIISEITVLKQQLEAVSHNKEMSVTEANTSQQTNEEFDTVRQKRDELSTENVALQAEVGRLRDLLDNLIVELERSRKGSNDLMQQRDGFKSLNEALMSELSRIKHELDIEVRENYSPTAENINPHIPSARSSTYPVSAPLTQSQQSHLQNYYSPSVATQRNLPQQLITPQPLANTPNGTSEYVNESSEDPKVYKSPQMSSTVSLPASPSQISVASNRTFTNGYSEKNIRRASMYNPSKPLPSLPTNGQGQRPKSFAFSLSNRKSLILPDKTDKITSSQSKIPKQIPMCQQCLKKHCKKKFPKGYSKFCSSTCKSAAQK
ncbi:16111_t:CDS:2, partial [Dentiscutata heterogama]